MKAIMAVVVCGGFLAMQAAYGQDPAPGLEKELSDLKARMGDLEKSAGAVRQRLGLAAGREKGGGGGMRDQEIAQLQEAAEAATKAVEDKTREKIMADPEGAKILADMDAAKTKLTELEHQLKDLEKNLGPVRQRLGLAGGRGKEGGLGSGDADVAGLRKAAEDARRAVDAKIRDKVRADPDGARIMEEMDKTATRIKDLETQLRGSKKRDK